MSDAQVKQQKPLEEASMPALWKIAEKLGISKEGKKDELIERIRQARENPSNLQPVVKAVKKNIIKSKKW